MSESGCSTEGMYAKVAMGARYSFMGVCICMNVVDWADIKVVSRGWQSCMGFSGKLMPECVRYNS